MNHNARGHTYRESGQYDKAIAEYNQAIQLDPTDKDAYRGRGITYASLEQFEKTIADFSKFIKPDPTKSWAYCLIPTQT